MLRTLVKPVSVPLVVSSCSLVLNCESPSVMLPCTGIASADRKGEQTAQVYLF